MCFTPNSFLILTSSCRAVAHFGFGSSFNWRLPGRQGHVALCCQILSRLPPLQPPGLFIVKLGTHTHTHPNSFTHAARAEKTIWEVILLPSLPSVVDVQTAAVYKVNASLFCSIVGRRVGQREALTFRPHTAWLMELNCGICQSKICERAMETGLNERARGKTTNESNITWKKSFGMWRSVTVLNYLTKLTSGRSGSLRCVVDGLFLVRLVEIKPVWCVMIFGAAAFMSKVSLVLWQ